MAILVRASHQMRAFEDRFLTIGLPYRVIGGPRFYERLEIRDAMAYFRLAVSPDDDLAFERIVNTPKRGLGDKAQQKIQVTARDNGTSLVDGARLLLQDGGLGGKGAKELRLLLDGIDRWHDLARATVAAAGGAADPLIDDSDGAVQRLDPAPTVSHIELADRSSRIRAIPRIGRPTRRPRRRAGSRTSRNWSRRWNSSTTCRGSSNTSR